MKNIQKQGQPPTQSLRTKLFQMRKICSNKEEEFEKIVKRKIGKLKNCYEKHQKIIEKIETPENKILLPSFEPILAEMSESAAECTILKEKIKQKQNQINLIQKKTQKHNKRLNEIQNEILNIKKELTAIQESSKMEEPESAQIEEELAMLKDKYFCAACQTRPRDSFFMGCGHTYCSECIQNLIKKRSRKCPTCRHIFSPSSDVKSLNFN